uniref:RING-type E3 ubiquitin transferase n=1 Tax=Megaselia scalaris TaxID=36166 RepID=T1GFD1_MEGSC
MLSANAPPPNATGGNSNDSHSQFLLPKFLAPSLADEQLAQIEKDRADRSQFVQALMLSTLSSLKLDGSDQRNDRDDYSDLSDMNKNSNSDMSNNNDTNSEVTTQTPINNQVDQQQQTNPDDFLEEYSYHQSAPTAPQQQQQHQHPTQPNYNKKKQQSSTASATAAAVVLERRGKPPPPSGQQQQQSQQPPQGRAKISPLSSYIMSRHEGVSCDSCLKSNFTGRRYKCLICYDYDLCADCYEDGATSTRHLNEHPMQCILTRADIELYFGGELLSTEQPQSFTCPYCKKMGYSDQTLADHVNNEHTETGLEVVCPVCAGSPGGDPNLVTDDFAGIRHGGGVRRIQPGRALGGPRSRRTNMHFSSSTGLATLSPSGRESVDPIAELLSQLSGVRRTGGSSQQSSQLQQLQMQIQLERQQPNYNKKKQQSSTASATAAAVVLERRGKPPPPSGQQQQQSQQPPQGRAVSKAVSAAKEIPDSR